LDIVTIYVRVPPAILWLRAAAVRGLRPRSRYLGRHRLNPRTIDRRAWAANLVDRVTTWAKVGIP
jgi:hypothetical protein